LPEWQKKELDKRLAAYDRGEVETIEWHQVHEDLKNNLIAREIALFQR